MREDIENIINEKYDEITPDLEDVYGSRNKEIQKLVEEQNTKVTSSEIDEEIDEEDIEYKEELLEQLDEAKENGIDLDYDEDMTIEALEDVLEEVSN